MVTNDQLTAYSAQAGGGVFSPSQSGGGGMTLDELAQQLNAGQQQAAAGNGYNIFNPPPQ
jgi:hypothetical protein